MISNVVVKCVTCHSLFIPASDGKWRHCTL